MTVTIERYSWPLNVSMTDDLATTQAIDIQGASSGQVNIPVGSSITGLTWYATTKEGGTFLAAQDASSNAVTQTVAAGESHPIPSILFGAALLKAVVNADGSVLVNLKT